MKFSCYNVINYIISDLFRYAGKTTWTAFVYSYVRNPTFRWQVAFRLVSARSIGYRILGYICWIINCNKKNICIPRGTIIGKGLYIGHNGPVVVNPTTVIGNNCNLSQFTTIGSNHGKAATIRDNVYIGPNVCIVEDVHIGSHVTIGAGSVVTKDIPDNATACGNYAKVINFKNPNRYIKNPYIV